MTDSIRDLPPPATEQDWAALHSFGGEFGGPAKRCLFDLRDRLAAVEARLAQVGVPASAFSGILAKAGGRPAFPARSVADVLADHAPQAPQGVTVEELVDCLPNSWTGDHDDFARYLLNHHRLGPLLRGEGAPAPDPVDLDALLAQIRQLILPHLRPPVAGVDVPGPDGDYWGLHDLCDAEGVDVRIGAPLLRRALAAWKQSALAWQQGGQDHE